MSSAASSVKSSSTLQVGIDLYPLCRRMSGVGIYIKYLMQAMLQDRSVEFVYPTAVSSQAWDADRKRRIAQQIGPELERVRWAGRYFPGCELVGRFTPMQWWRFPQDLYHITSTLCWFSPQRVPTLVTAYDLAWMRLPKSIYRTPRQLDLSWRYPRLLRAAQHVVCISEVTRQDVAQLAGVPEERLSVTPLAARPEFFPPADTTAREQARQQANGDRPFFLAIGTLEPRKNYPRLIAAFAQLVKQGWPHQLVIIGGQGPDSQAVQEAIQIHRLEEDVILKGYVADEDLLPYFWGAEALIMVSLYEGFGLPVLEAMASGLPVIAATAGSLPEVAGDAAVLVEALEVDDIAQAMIRLASDSNLKQQLQVDGIARAAEFSWAETARQTIEAYHLVRG